jgi:hypothetical protein
MTLACGGFSAFIYGTIARLLFPGDTSNLLLFLALGNAIPSLIGSMLLPSVHQPETDRELEDVDPQKESVAYKTLDPIAPLKADDAGTEDACETDRLLHSSISNSGRCGWLAIAEPTAYDLLKMLDFWLIYCIGGCCTSAFWLM